jgi:hypothetical protein
MTKKEKEIFEKLKNNLDWCWKSGSRYAGWKGIGRYGKEYYYLGYDGTGDQQCYFAPFCKKVSIDEVTKLLADNVINKT